ncbi:hypothetical protein ACFZCU_44290 [Streptomyces canus]|uniref:hypothetical protein n=1 Tax=Streptomyces canus TaxID=58343 RepID=UPI0036EB41AB
MQAIAVTPRDQTSAPSERISAAAELPQPKPQKAERPAVSAALEGGDKSCAQLRSRIDPLAAEGKKTVACIAPAPARKPSPSEISALVDRQPVPWTDWCFDSSNGDDT